MIRRLENADLEEHSLGMLRRIVAALILRMRIRFVRAKEYEECMNKASALLKAVALAEQGME